MIGRGPATRRRLLFLSRDLPLQRSHGSASYSLALIAHLVSRGWVVDYALVGPETAPRSGWLALPAAASAVLAGDPFRRPSAARLLVATSSLPLALRNVGKFLLPDAIPAAWRALIGRARRRAAPSETPEWDAPASRLEVALARRVARIARPDVVIADYAWLAPLLDAFDDSSALRAVFTHDLLHERVDSFARAGLPSGHRRWTQEEELELLTRARVLIAIQAQECAKLRALLPGREVVTVGMPATRIGAESGRQVPARCLFVGTRAAHNAQGLAWFLAECWPRIIARRPDATIHVAGTVCGDPALAAVPSGVRLLGRLDDLGPEYAAAQVVVAPLLAGSGLKIKLVEALSAGRACISTTTGVQGIEEAVGRSVLVADSAAAFSDATLEVIEDAAKRHALEAEALAFARVRLAPERVFADLDAILGRHFERAP